MKKLFLAACSLSLIAQAGTASAQVTHDFKLALDVHEDSSRPCMLFRLEGVSLADPASGNEWFAVPRTHIAFSELFALLLTSRALRLPLLVSTTGALSCGYASVNAILIRN